MLITTILLLLTYVQAQSSQCQFLLQGFGDDSVWTDYHDFKPNQTSNLILHNEAISGIDMGMGVATSIMHIEGYNETEKIGFFVRGNIADRDLLQLKLTIRTNTKWVSAHVHYLISGNENLAAGYEPLPQKQLNNLQPDNYISYSIPRPLPSNSQPVVFVFLSGVISESMNIDISFQPDSFSYHTGNSTLTFILITQGDTHLIENIYISYIIYGKASTFEVQTLADLNAYIDRAKQGGDPLDNGHSFVGLKGINGSGVEGDGNLTISSGVEGDGDLIRSSGGVLLRNTGGETVDLLQNKLFTEVFEISGLRIETTAADGQKFVLSPAGELISDTDSVCLRDCVRDNGYVDVRNGSKICIVCQNPNRRYNPHVQECLCEEGLVLINGTCMSEEEACDGDTYVDGKCIKLLLVGGQELSCAPNEEVLLDGRKCVCKEGFQRVGRDCVRVCTRNQMLEQGECVCYGELVGEECKKCGDFSLYSRESGKCECVEGAYIVEGHCTICPPHSNYNEQREVCECESGYRSFGKICRKNIQQTVAFVDVSEFQISGF